MPSRLRLVTRTLNELAITNGGDIMSVDTNYSQSILRVDLKGEKKIQPHTRWSSDFSRGPNDRHADAQKDDADGEEVIRHGE